MLWQPATRCTRARRTRGRRGDPEAAGRSRRWCSAASTAAARPPTPDRRGLAAGRALPCRRARHRAAPFIAELLADAELGARLTRLSPDTCRVLDLCTGNGSLAVLSAMAFPTSRSTPQTFPDARWRWPASTSTATSWLAHPAWSERRPGRARAGRPLRPDPSNRPRVNAASMAALPPNTRAEPQIAPGARRHGPRAPVAEGCAHAFHVAEDAVLVLEIGNERGALSRPPSRSSGDLAGRPARP